MIGRLIAAIALALIATPLHARPIPVDGGQVDGIALPSGVEAWLGVPFAAPPLRELRWKPPQPAKPWPGVYHADRFAPECLQPLRGSRQNHYFGNEATSEDCLYLNIWAPTRAKMAPVIVWIYGGGFNIGSAQVGEDVYEVVLKIDARAETEDGQVAFVVDLSYAGLFGLRNVPAEQLQPFLLAEAPRLLFPFARHIVAEAVRDGGFPPLMLDPIDFGGLYVQQAAQAEQLAEGEPAGQA